MRLGYLGVEMIKKKKLDILIFIGIFFTSIVGAQVFGVSLNKIALIPLEISMVLMGRKKIFMLPKKYFPFFLFWCVQIIGSLIALVSFDKYIYAGYQSILATNIIQCMLIWIPLGLGLFVYEDKKSIFKSTKNAIVLTARIHVVYLILQFLLWHTVSFDLNGFIFTELFHNFFGSSFNSVFINMGSYGVHTLRTTGLNYDPAFTSAVMVAGFVFDCSNIIKCLYLVATLMAYSRSGTIAIIIIILYKILKKISENNLQINKKKILIFVLSVFAGTIVVLYMYRNLEFFRNTIDSSMTRVTSSLFDYGSIKNGGRHYQYPIYALYSWLFDLNIFQKIFGVGSRTTGLVFVLSPYVSQNMSFYPSMLSSAWQIECDFAAILLGEGLLGYVLYLMILKKLLFSHENEMQSYSIGIFAFGFMYAIFLTSFTHVILLILFVCVKEMNKKTD